MDLASLAIAVDSRQVARARDELGKFVPSAQGAERAVKGVEKAMADTERRAEAFGRQIGTTVRNALGALGVGLGARELANYADAWTNAGNRIKAVGVPLEQVGRIQNELVSLAMRSRSELTGVVDLYAKLTSASGELGASQAQVARVTETVAKAFVVGGASTAEANSATIQLAQALASGALRGEELNAILEASPPLARLIADSFGITIGQLRKYGEEGKLTAQSVFNAILQGSTEIDEAFSKTQMTIGQAITNLNTGLTQYIGTLDQSYGVSARLAEAIQWVADNMDTVSRYIQAAGLTLMAYFGPGVIASITTAILAMTAALLANPFGALAVALAAVVSYMVAFRDSIHPIAGELALVSDYLSVMIDWGSQFASGFGSAFSSVLSSAVNAFSGIEMSGAQMADFMLSVVDRIIGVFITGYNAVVAIWTGLPGAVGEVATNAANAVVGAVEWMLQQVAAGINGLIGIANSASELVGGGSILEEFSAPSLGRLENSFAGAGATLGKELQRSFEAASAPYLRSTLESLSSEANRIAAERAGAQAAAGANESATTATEGLGVVGGGGGGGGGGKKGRGRASEYERLVESINNEILALQAEAETLGMTAQQAERYMMVQELLSAAKASGIPITDALRQNVEQLADSYIHVSEEAARAREEQERMADFASEMKGMFSGALKGFISDIRQGKSLTEALGNALNKIADKLIDMAINQLFENAFGGLGGGSGGGFLSSLFGGLFGGGLPFNNFAAGIPIFHDGGVVGAGASSYRIDDPRNWNSAPRMHSGSGLRPGERRAILEDGEVVLPKGQVARERALGRVGVSPQAGAMSAPSEPIQVVVDVQPSGEFDARVQRVADQRSQKAIVTFAQSDQFSGSVVNSVRKAQKIGDM